MQDSFLLHRSSVFRHLCGACLFVAALPLANARIGLNFESSAGESRSRFAPAQIEFFEKKIRPLLVENCYNCHSDKNGGKGGLRVDDRNGLIEGGGRGPGIKPGYPDDSLLIKAVRHQGIQMPPKKKLTDEQISDLERWIRDGAAWPAVEVPEDLQKPNPEYDRLRAEHWAWQPMKQITPPPVPDKTWISHDLDRFILAKLGEAELTPAPDADRYSLIRRVTFDLTGLQPTVAEVNDFVADLAPDAYEKLVDRLIKMPAFGERWARHWLDIARYGESTGSARNIPLPHAWRYRDYVINAFNSDKPYDQFVREQIAGDLLPANSVAQKAEQLIATGFLALGVKDVNQRFKVRFIMDNIDEQIDAVTRSILGLTISCARCHDHKFDPVPTTDYYALAGIFHSSDLCGGVRSKMGGSGYDYYDTSLLLDVGLDSTIDANSAKKVEELTKLVEAAQNELKFIRGTPAAEEVGPNGQTKEQISRQKLVKVERELFELTDPALSRKLAYGVRDSQTVGDTEIRVRGEAEQLGPTVARGFISLLAIPDVPKINPRQSGRLELAYWLTSENNPLTQRVIVNRVWQYLFDQGLVTSSDNFGITGDRPSHPELLDFLSQQFVRDGWSIKRLVRSLVLSRSYRLSTDLVPENFALDPGNRLLWRHKPRRLDAEEIRDAMLQVSGRINLAPLAGSAAMAMKVIEITDVSPEAKRLEDAARNSLHRSIYLPLVRGVTPRSLEVFDLADQGLVTGVRDVTTVPTQALYLLNDSFVRTQALGFAERLLQLGNLSDSDRVNLAYQWAFARPATAVDRDRALQFLSEAASLCNQLVADADLALTSPVSALLPTNSSTSSTANSTTQTTSAAAAKTNGAGSDRSGSRDAFDGRDPQTVAWASFCQALMGAAEFRYLR